MLALVQTGTSLWQDIYLNHPFKLQMTLRAYHGYALNCFNEDFFQHYNYPNTILLGFGQTVI